MWLLSLIPARNHRPEALKWFPLCCWGWAKHPWSHLVQKSDKNCPEYFQKVLSQVARAMIGLQVGIFGINSALGGFLAVLPSAQLREEGASSFTTAILSFWPVLAWVCDPW